MDCPRPGPPAGLPRAWPTGLPPVVHAERANGGCVATVWFALLGDGTRAVVKSTPFPADGEADGLAALAQAGVPVPRVLGLAARTLVLERVGGRADWAGLGRAVAGMHRVGSERYGWHRDNHAGRFRQPNAWTDDWPTFFVDRRVRPHLVDAAVPPELRHRLERACDGPLQALLPQHPPAVLTHGDLWRGNTVDGHWLIDPEVCHADRELDLAYMQMSPTRPLPRIFWSAYTEVLPVPDGFYRRRRALELHHRLLQVRHFGDRDLPGVHAVLAHYGW